MQLTSIYPGKVVLTIFAKNAQEFLLFVESNLMLTKNHLFLYIMLLFVLTSTIAVKYGMCSAKHNLNDFKNYRIERLELH